MWFFERQQRQGDSGNSRRMLSINTAIYSWVCLDLNLNSLTFFSFAPPSQIKGQASQLMKQPFKCWQACTDNLRAKADASTLKVGLANHTWSGRLQASMPIVALLQTKLKEQLNINYLTISSAVTSLHIMLRKKFSSWEFCIFLLFHPFSIKKRERERFLNLENHCIYQFRLSLRYILIWQEILGRDIVA